MARVIKKVFTKHMGWIIFLFIMGSTVLDIFYSNLIQYDKVFPFLNKVRAACGDPPGVPNAGSVNPEGTPSSQSPKGTPCNGDTDPINFSDGSYGYSATDIVVKGKTNDIAFKRFYRSNQKSNVIVLNALAYYTQYSENTRVVHTTWILPETATLVGSAGVIEKVTFSESGSYSVELLIEYEYATLAAPAGAWNGFMNASYASEWIWQEGTVFTTHYFPINYVASTTDAHLGTNWDYNYNIRLDEFNSSTIFLYDGRFGRITFTGSNGQFTTDAANVEYKTLVKNQNGTYTLSKKNKEVWEFNSSGQITNINDYLGHGLSFSYSNRLSTITNDLGKTLSFTYTGGGQIDYIQDSDGRRVDFGYSSDNLVTVKKPETDYTDLVTTYGYDGSHQLTSISDPYSNQWLTNTYTNGKVTTQRYGTTGQDFTLSYDATAQKVTQTDRRGNQAEFFYNNAGQTVSAKRYDGSSNFTTSYTYDTSNLLTAITRPKGNKIEYGCDSRGNLTSYKKSGSGSSLQSTFTYDTDDFIQTYTDPRNNTYQYVYSYEDQLYGSSDRNLRKIIFPTVQNENGTNVTPDMDFTYNSAGQVTEVELPDGTLVEYVYGTSGNNNGKVTTMTYDYGTGDTLNLEYQFTYDSYGSIDTVTKPDSTSINLDYNALHQLTQIQNELNYATRYHYNKNGMVDKIQRQLGSSYGDSTAQTWEYTFDILDKMATITDPLSNITTLGRDDNENVTSAKDPEGADANPNYSTGYTYNARNLLTRIADAESGQVNYGYDDNGNLLTATDNNGKATTYSYDFADRLTTITYHDSSYEQFTYDYSSNITQERKRDGTTIYYTYDALNRKISKQVGSGTTTHFKYDIAGRLRYVVDGSTTVASYGYDRIGRLASATDSASKTAEYQYNNSSLRTRLTYPDDSYITYEYYNDGNVHYIKDSSNNALATFTYDELGRMTRLTGGNGAYENFDYEDASGNDNKGLNIEQVSYSTSSMNGFGYTRDKVGNATQKSYGSATYDFTYDKTYQLKTTDWPGTGDDWTFNYDKVYNRTSTVQDSTTRTYTLKTNGLNQYDTIDAGPAVSFSYTNGNLTNDGTYKYYYSCENMLRDVNTVGDTHVASYTYDWAGRRITKTYNLVTTTYVYDGPHIIAEYNGSTLLRKYVYGPGIDLPILMIAVDGETETRYYYFRDAVGSVVALLNNSGSVVEAYNYDPLGKPSVHTAAGSDSKWLTSDDTTASSSAFDNRLMFTAREWDSESGLYYYRARMYHPTIGRFLQPDPIGYYDSMNLYQYCLNNPVNWIDPYGETIALPAIGVGGGIGAAIAATGKAIAAAAASAPVAAGAIAFGVGYGAGTAIDHYTGASNHLAYGMAAAWAWAADDGGGSGSGKQCEPSDAANDAVDKIKNGENPGSDWTKKGPNWKNDKTGESLHPDLNNQKEGPHVDWHKRGYPKRRL